VHTGAGASSRCGCELLDGKRLQVAGVSSFGLADYTEEMFKSGFPGLRDLPVKLRYAQLDGYLQRIIDKDFPELGHQPRDPAALRRWMLAYAAATATTASWEKVRDAATGGESDKPARTTVMPYRDVLERLYVLDPLPGWRPSRNHIKRLTEPPKHHLADPALATTLLGLSSRRLLAGDEPAIPVPRDGTFLGALFESLVTQSVRVYAQASDASRWAPTCWTRWPSPQAPRHTAAPTASRSCRRRSSVRENLPLGRQG
jgi:predicted AAA+ superfamily ATPase